MSASLCSSRQWPTSCCSLLEYMCSTPRGRTSSSFSISSSCSRYLRSGIFFFFLLFFFFFFSEQNLLFSSWQIWDVLHYLQRLRKVRAQMRMLENGAYFPAEQQAYDPENAIYHAGSNLPPMRRPGAERYTFTTQSPHVPYMFTDVPPPPSYDDITKEAPPAFQAEYVAPQVTDEGSSHRAEVTTTATTSLPLPLTTPAAPLPTYQASEQQAQEAQTQTNPQVQETQ